ncbi:MAG: PadR family transcriptional regulator [Candidatus Promineifilaceae bacterium]|jgi:DNA-binding PadR family transcriptional regulator
MEKRLLLLSALRNHEMHGYQLNELLGRHAGIPIKVTGSNAYKLLNRMEEDGWITYYEEQEGNRPPRRVYRMTAEGEKVFQQMLRDSLAAYVEPEFPSATAFNIIDLLPPEEAIALLQARREKVAANYEEIAGVGDEMRQYHLSVEYLQRFYQSEIEWVDELIARLNNK